MTYAVDYFVLVLVLLILQGDCSEFLVFTSQNCCSFSKFLFVMANIVSVDVRLLLSHQIPWIFYGYDLWPPMCYPNSAWICQVFFYPKPTFRIHFSHRFPILNGFWTYKFYYLCLYLLSIWFHPYRQGVECECRWSTP